MCLLTIGKEFLDDKRNAREAGFSTRYSNSRKNKMTNEVICKQFVCFKTG